MKRELLSRNEKGAAAVEFAILLPLLIFLLAGSIEYGLLMFNQQVLTNASREAARAGIVSQTPRVANATISTVALTYCQNFLVTFDAADPAPTVVTSLPDGTRNIGDRLQVRVQYNYQFLFLPNIQGLFGGGTEESLALKATTTMRYE